MINFRHKFLRPLRKWKKFQLKKKRAELNAKFPRLRAWVLRRECRARHQRLKADKNEIIQLVRSKMANGGRIVLLGRHPSLKGWRTALTNIKIEPTTVHFCAIAPRHHSEDLFDLRREAPRLDWHVETKAGVPVFTLDTDASADVLRVELQHKAVQKAISDETVVPKETLLEFDDDCNAILKIELPGFIVNQL